MNGAPAFGCVRNTEDRAALSDIERDRLIRNTAVLVVGRGETACPGHRAKLMKEKA